jgi:hypothetical protein
MIACRIDQTLGVRKPYQEVGLAPKNGEWASQLGSGNNFAV